MAKRKHHKKRTHRRVGAMSLDGSNPIIKLAALAGGYFLLADSVNGLIDKAVPAAATHNTAVGAAQAGIGTLALLNKKGSKTMRLITTAAGGITAGAGLKRLLKGMGMVSGYQQVPVIGGRRQGVGGYQQVPVIGSTPGQLQGRPAQLQGYRVNGYRVNGGMHPGAAAAMPNGVTNYRD